MISNPYSPDNFKQLKLLFSVESNEVKYNEFWVVLPVQTETNSCPTTTTTVLLAMNRGEQLLKLSGICHDNARNLLHAVHTCHELGIGAFRLVEG